MKQIIHFYQILFLLVSFIVGILFKNFDLNPMPFFLAIVTHTIYEHTCSQVQVALGKPENYVLVTARGQMLTHYDASPSELGLRGQNYFWGYGAFE